VAMNGNNRSRLLLVTLLVTSLFLITLDLRGVSVTQSSRSATQSFLAPIQRGVSDFFSPVGNFFSNVKNFGKTKAELNQVKKQNEALKKEVVLNSDIKGQLDQLKGALDLAARGGFKVVAARVIGHGSASTFSQTITLDVGSTSGIRKDQTVISESGLVGVVKEVTSSSAIVLLMSDPTFRVGVRIARSQGMGVLIGQGGKRYLVQLLDSSGKFQVGDALLTLGSDGFKPFVSGIPVGKIISVNSTTASLTQEADVSAYSNLGELGVVTVIVGNLSSDPHNALVPTPAPTRTVYVTSTGAPPVDTATLTPSPSPSLTSAPKKKATK